MIDTERGDVGELPLDNRLVDPLAFLICACLPSFKLFQSFSFFRPKQTFSKFLGSHFSICTFSVFGSLLVLCRVLPSKFWFTSRLCTQQHKRDSMKAKGQNSAHFFTRLEPHKVKSQAGGTGHQMSNNLATTREQHSSSRA